MKIIKGYVMTRQLTETMVIPEHVERKESAEFRAAKKQLKKDGNYKCWICGSTEKLQVHHFLYEHCIKDTCDYNKLKEVCEQLDVYGYGKQMKDIPLTSVDDIRNMMVLCQEHHTGGMTDGCANGIHNISFSAWISQKIAIDGKDPIPDNRQELQQIQDELYSKQDI